jgi:Rps23 Pro-64 3,4-dihydroxylase Tpa1-like proline 4-hydroxylase
MVEATTMGMPSPQDIEECEDCRDKYDILAKSNRQNDVVFLDSHYENRRGESKILSYLEVALNSRGFLEAFKSFPNMFPSVLQTTHLETILSSYGKCDFYGWHTDTIPGSRSARIITCVLHWNTEPQQFEGGELILAGKTIEDQLPYSPVHNTAIFFQSNQCLHAVDATVFEGDFKDSRFSINAWLGFQSEDSNAPRPFGFKYR